MGVELGNFSEQGLSGVLSPGFMGLSRQTGFDGGSTPTSVAGEGRVSLDFFGSFLLVVSSVGKEECTFVVFFFFFQGF